MLSEHHVEKTDEDTPRICTTRSTLISKMVVVILGYCCAWIILLGISCIEYSLLYHDAQKMDQVGHCVNYVKDLIAEQPQEVQEKLRRLDAPEPFNIDQYYDEQKSEALSPFIGNQIAGIIRSYTMSRELKQRQVDAIKWSTEALGIIVDGPQNHVPMYPEIFTQ